LIFFISSTLKFIITFAVDIINNDDEKQDLL